jgi:iron(III) transport system ATP-binding protein
MVFQDYALFPHLTVAGNISFGLRAVADQAARLEETIALVGLGHLRDRLPAELSGGQQQRVALARALAPRPAVLLMDEPFSNLDGKLRAQVREQVREILTAAGTAAIFVTHDQDEALFMGDRIAVLDWGAIEQVGTPEEVFHKPATRFVAEFIGDTSFLPGRVTAGGVETELGVLEQHTGLPDGSDVQVLVRPDDLELAPDAAGNAHVDRRLFRGIHNRYRVELPSGDAVYCLTDHSLRYEPGAAVRVTFARRHPLVVFREGRAVNGTAAV